MNVCVLWQAALKNTDVQNHTAIVVEVGVENQSFEFVAITLLRRRNAVDNCIKNLIDVFASFRGNLDDFRFVTAEQIHDFCRDARHVASRQIDLINHRNNFQILLECEINVCERLSLNTLRCIDDKNRAFNSLKTTGNLIRKINVARGVDEIQNMVLPVHVGWRELDSNTLLALKFHAIEELRFHLAFFDCTGHFEHAVRKRRLTMIDMRNDAKISNLIYIHNNILPHCQESCYLMSSKTMMMRAKTIR